MSVTRGTTGDSLAEQRAPLGVRDDVLEQRDRQALADARAFVDARVLPRLERDLLDHLAHELRHLDVEVLARVVHASCAVIAIASCRVAG